MHLIEGFAIVFNLGYVWLASRQSIWCWPVSIVGVILYFYLTLQRQLYAESALQIYYLGISVYGWLYWKKNETEGQQVVSWSGKQHLLVIVTGLIGTFITGFFLNKYTSAALPFFDAATTVFAIITTWMVARKVLENWLYWIVIDLASIYLYWLRDLRLSTLLFLFYTIFAIYGYQQWHKSYRSTNNK
jgi:nicotinamide mononucleotide transporter